MPHPFKIYLLIFYTEILFYFNMFNLDEIFKNIFPLLFTVRKIVGNLLI